jgi:hypothetical protein
VKKEMNFLVQIYAGKFLSSCATSGFTRRTQLHGVSSEGIWKEAIMS